MPTLSPQQERKLKKVARLVEDGDFAITEHLFELEEKVDECLEMVDSKVEEMKGMVSPNLNNILEQIKGKDGYTPQKGVDYFDGEKGEAGKDAEITPTIIKKIAEQVKVPIVEKVIEKTETIREQPIVTEVVKENPFILKGTEIVEKLEALSNDESLPIEAIKDLREELDELKKIRSNGKSYSFFGGGGGGGGRIVKVHDLTDQLNGVLKTFSLPAFWRIISVNSSSFPFVFRPTIDYTTSGATITFTSEIEASTTLATGQTLLVTYAE